MPRPTGPRWATVARHLVPGTSPGNTLLLFAASAAAAEPPSEDVVVEAARPDGPDPAATSASVTVLPVDARVPASADVAELLDTASGTSVQRLGGLGDFSAVSIRGATLRQVEVFLDGVPLNPDGADVVNLSELPLAAFERLEVWRGNAPASFLASPIGGVVNLVSRGDGPGRATASYGSWDTARATAFDSIVSRPTARGYAGDPLEAQFFADAFSTRGDFTYFADNATTYNLLDDHFLTRGNNDKRQLSAHGRVRATRGNTRLTLFDAPLSREEGLPGTTSLPAEAARLATTRNLAVASADACGPRTSGTATLWHLFRDETLDDREGEINSGRQWSRSTFNTLGLRAHGNVVPAAWVVPALATGLRGESVVTEDLLGSAATTERSRLVATLAASADFRFWVDRITLSPVVTGTVLDNRSVAAGVPDYEGGGADVPVVDGSVDPRLGLLLRPLPFLSLKANVGRYLRPPDLTELYGDRGGIIGNPELLPERGTHADVGARWELSPGHWGQLALDTAAFWLWSTDRIVWVQNTQHSVYPVNYGKTGVQGIEAAIDAQLFDRLDVGGSLTWQRSLNLTEGSSFVNNELPRTPPLELSLSASVHWQETLRLGYNYAYTAPNYWDGSNLYRSAPRELHGAFVRAQPGPRWPRVELAALNLLDTTTEVVPRDPARPDDEHMAVVATTDFIGYPLPGRTFITTLGWDI